MKKLLLICLSDKAKIALFFKIIEFYFDLRPTGRLAGKTDE